MKKDKKLRYIVLSDTCTVVGLHLVSLDKSKIFSSARESKSVHYFAVNCDGSEHGCYGCHPIFEK